MKPVIIITIAVVCSVVAVFVVLIGYDMYKSYQIQRGLVYGVDVEKRYQYHLNNISDCVPNNKNCFNNIIGRFDDDFDKISYEYGFNINEPQVEEYRQMAHNFFKIEYEYQNEIYSINSDYYGSSYVSGTDELAKQWQNAYISAVNQIQHDTKLGKSMNSSFTVVERSIQDCLKSSDYNQCVRDKYYQIIRQTPTGACADVYEFGTPEYGQCMKDKWK